MKTRLPGAGWIGRAGLATALCGLAAAQGQASPLTLAESGAPACIVVYDAANPAESFAVKELNEIVRGTLGFEWPTASLADADGIGAPTNRVLVGRLPAVRTALGPALFDALEPQESLVTRRGNDLILAGGDDWGTIYAVYDFVENELGYRCFAPYPGGERFVRTDRVAFSGTTTRRRPAFDGYRLCYISPLLFRENRQAFNRFLFRNRGTRLVDKWGPGAGFADDIGLVEPYRLQVPGHGLFLFVPPVEQKWVFWRKGTLAGSFDEHPEFFTWSDEGRRVSNSQLCLSSPELRRLLTTRILEAIEAKGDGVYMVGSNDHQHRRYCWCPGCRALEEKYQSTGGPLWDYILELCERVKAEHPRVFISSLAYKGPEQTEKAPADIVFPDNFICDAGFLNAFQSLREIPDLTLENGAVYNRFENLKDWVGITKHVSYWYYGGCAPFQVYERPAKELRELHEAGVRSVGACGLGSMEFGDITTYLYLRLLVDPALDERKLVEEFTAFNYGAAAEPMMAFIDELERLRNALLARGAESLVETADGSPAKDEYGRLVRWSELRADDTYEHMVFLEPEQILRWQDDFDRMLAIVADDPSAARNVRIARTAVDCWTVAFMGRIRTAFPDREIDIDRILERGLLSAREAIDAGRVNPDTAPALKVLNDMSLYANLQSEALPSELAPHPASRVKRYLPLHPEPLKRRVAELTEDPDAVAGWAMREIVKEPAEFVNGVPFEFYDETSKQWLKTGSIPVDAIRPGEYQLHKLFVERLPPKNRLVFGHFWGTSLDIQKLGLRYYDPTYHQRLYEIWASVKCDGPVFDPDSAGTVSTIACDQVFLVDLGMPEEQPEAAQ